MPRLELKLRDGCQEPYVEFYIDGQDLGPRVMAALGEAGFDDVLPWYGGDYTREEAVLGTEARVKGLHGAVLFACGCGYWACSGVVADVEVTDDTVTIQRIFTWRGNQRVAADLEPLVFDRVQFDEAVRALERDIAVWRPSEKPNR